MRSGCVPVGCGQWVLVLCDPQLNPLQRLDVRSASLTWQADNTATSQVELRRSCSRQPVREGWHHVCAYRCDHAQAPLLAGVVTKVDGDTLEVIDLSWWLNQRSSTLELVGSSEADPGGWVKRIIKAAVGVPLIGSPSGPVSTFTAVPEIKEGDSLSSVLYSMKGLGLAWSMQGMWLRYGASFTAPQGPLLTDRQFANLDFAASVDIVSQVVITGKDEVVGVWPDSPRRTQPFASIAIEANELITQRACTALARQTYEAHQTRAVSLSNSVLKRGAPLCPIELICGRRFPIVDCSNQAMGRLNQLTISLSPYGNETSVAVDFSTPEPLNKR